MFQVKKIWMVFCSVVRLSIGYCENLPLVTLYKGSFPARYYVHNMPNESSCLDNNHQAFLLVDDGSVGHRGSETSFRANLEDFISHQRTGIWGEREREDSSATKQLQNMFELFLTTEQQKITFIRDFDGKHRHVPQELSTSFY